MNLAFKAVFGTAKPTLPLQDGGHIVCGNATRENWEEVCPKDEGAEIVIMGNPPFQGSKDQSDLQKNDLTYVFETFRNYKKLDYVSCWFKKAVDYSYLQNNQTKFAFVSTNSICQGEQVNLLWSYVFEKDLSINFAYQSFDWSNNAKGNAGVTCIIVGVSERLKGAKKYIYKNNTVSQVDNISPYLIQGSDICVFPRRNTLSKIPKMVRGSQPTDDGNLIFSESQKTELLQSFPKANIFIKSYMGADDFINNKQRYCLWIKESELNDALEIPIIKARINKCSEFRSKSKKPATRKKAEISYRFDEVKHEKGGLFCFQLYRQAEENIFQ